MSDRMLTDWIQRGLLARPDVKSRGIGVEAEYDADQVRLAIKLLDKHRPGHSVDGLYNEPVAIWLYWHNQGIVPLSQAKRAWSSWARRRSTGGRSGVEGTKAARGLAVQFQAAGVSRKASSELFQAFAAANTTGTLDLDAINAAVGDQIDKPQLRGMVRVLERLYVGIEHREDFTDDDFYQARAEHLAVMSPEYRRDNVEPLVKTTCHNLTVHLGDVYLSK